MPDAPEPIQIPDKGYILVDTAEALAETVERLRGSEALAIDTEADSFFSYRESCCLVQITGDDTPDFIIDPLAVKDLSPLQPLTSDPKITKIFHGADYDVVSMKRDFGLTFTNLFDTMISAQATGHERFGLSDLVMRYFGAKLDKKWQRHDWSARPLTKPQLDYARLDSHFLHHLRRILWEQAEACGRQAMIEEECQLLESREWTEREFDPDDCMKVKGARKLDEKGRKVLRALYAQRDSMAAARNRPAFKVWGNDVLLKLAAKPPTNRQELAAVLGDNHYVLRRHASHALEAVEEGLNDESAPPPLQTKEVVAPRGLPPFTRDDEPLLQALKKWRNRRAKELGLGPGMVLNNGLLRDAAAVKPASVEDLEPMADMRRWQKAEFGQELVDAVQTWLAANPAPPEGEGEGKGGRRRRRRRRRGADDAPPRETGDA